MCTYLVEMLLDADVGQPFLQERYQHAWCHLNQPARVGGARQQTSRFAERREGGGGERESHEKQGDRKLIVAMSLRHVPEAFGHKQHTAAVTPVQPLYCTLYCTLLYCCGHVSRKNKMADGQSTITNQCIASLFAYCGLVCSLSVLLYLT